MAGRTQQIIKNLLSTRNILFTTNRNYVRWQHRRPRRILYGNEHENDKRETGAPAKKPLDILKEYKTKYNMLKEIKSNTKILNENDSIIQNTTNKTIQETIKKQADKNFPSKDNSIEVGTITKNGISFEKLVHNDRKLSKLLTNVKLKKYRERNNIVLLEGKRLIRDALLANCIPEIIFFSRITDLDSFKELLLEHTATKFYKVPYKDLQLWSPLTTCPGIMGIFKIPNTSERPASSENHLPITIICDNIREPGNLGTIIRTVAAVGCEKLLLTKGCVDLWEPKVLRSACGGHFRLTIDTNQTWNDIRMKFNNPAVFIADNNMETCISLEFATCSYDNIHLDSCREIVVIIGGETFGVSQDAYNFAGNFHGTRVYIPLENGVESLNTGAALAVIIFEMRRQLRTQQEQRIGKEQCEASNL